MAESVTNSKALETMVALRYWARATNYDMTAEERAVISACDQKASELWRAGVGLGGFGGLALATGVSVPMLSRLAVGSAFASVGGFYGTFRANSHW